jgi:peptidoglycan/LPS O-acetylase OafA/YrhL
LPNKEHIPALDGLRGVACLLILVGHFLSQNRQAVAPAVLTAFSQYWSGVDLFFVLSGFVIVLSLVRLRGRTDGFARLLRLYATSRAFRILPVYALFLSAYFCLPRLFPRLAHDELFLSSIPGYVYLFFGQSWYMAIHQRGGAEFVDASWSLCAEVFLYALSFLIICLAPRRTWIRAMAATVAASFACRLFIVMFTGNLLAAYLLPVCRMDGFMIGGAVAVLYAEGRLKPLRPEALNLALLLLLCVFAALSLAARHFASEASILFSYAFYSIFYSLILVRLTSGTFPVLSRGPLSYIGTVSYFVYLFHFPIVYWMKQACDDLRWGVGPGFVMTLAVTLGAATVSWYAFERPLIALGRSLNRLGARAAP